jgi:hypothetical protein
MAYHWRRNGATKQTTEARMGTCQGCGGVNYIFEVNYADGGNRPISKPTMQEALVERAKWVAKSAGAHSEILGVSDIYED